MQGEPSRYAVIIDRISQDVPFYRAYLKNAALNGTAVVNNPFWWSADEKFFNNCLATKVGVAVPKTVLLPSNEHPPDTSGESFRNLACPLDWEAIFDYIGFPAYFKPLRGGGWKNVYKVKDAEDFFAKYHETGQLVMLLQEEIVFDEYFRCYVLDCRDVLIMPYDPRNPHHLRYVRRPAAGRGRRCSSGCARTRSSCNRALGYDFNTVEFAVRDGVPYAIDFCNPAPDADVHSVGEDNFDWVRRARRPTWRSARPQAHARRPEQPDLGRVRPSFAAGRLSDLRRVGLRSASATGSSAGSRSRRRLERRASVHPRDRGGVPAHRSGDARPALAHPASCSRTARTRRSREQFKPEMHQSVVEVGTDDLRRHPRGAARGHPAAPRARRGSRRRNGLTIAAAGTHPFAHWQDQQITPNARYDEIVEDLQQVARANLIFGLHVHVGIRDREIGDPHHERGALLPAAHLRAVDQLAVLGRAQHRLQVLSRARSSTASRAPASPTTSTAVASTRTTSSC